MDPAEELFLFMFPEDLCAGAFLAPEGAFPFLGPRNVAIIQMYLMVYKLFLKKEKSPDFPIL